MKNLSIITLFTLSWLPLKGQNFRSQLQEAANEINRKLVEGKHTPVSISSFIDPNNSQTTFGKFLADKFTIQLQIVNSTMKIVDRTALDQILKENKMAAERLLNPTTIPQLGQWTGSKTLITGSYFVLGSTIDLSIKAIDIQQGILLSHFETTLALTPEFKSILNINGPIDPNLGPLPIAKSDCGEKLSCVVCVTNLGTSMIIASPRLSNQMSGQAAGDRLAIENGERKCWPEMWFSMRDKVDRITISVTVNDQAIKHYKQDIVPCKSYNIIHKTD